MSSSVGVLYIFFFFFVRHPRNFINMRVFTRVIVDRRPENNKHTTGRNDCMGRTVYRRR